MTLPDLRGTIEVENNEAAIRFIRRLPFPLETVWSAITEPEQLAVWLGPAAIEPRQGGSAIVESGPEDVPLEARRSVGRVLVWEPPHVLEFEWRQAIVEASTLRYELQAEGDSTVLTFVHRWLSVSNASGFIPGWHLFLDRLAGYLGKSELPTWGEGYARISQEYGGWQRK